MLPVPSGSSFETPAARAPQDEGGGFQARVDAPRSFMLRSIAQQSVSKHELSPETTESSIGPERYPPLTAPAVRPATICRCATTVRISTGRVTMRAAAARGPQLNCSKDSML